MGRDDPTYQQEQNVLDEILRRGFAGPRLYCTDQGQPSVLIQGEDGHYLVGIRRTSMALPRTGHGEPTD